MVGTDPATCQSHQAARQHDDAPRRWKCSAEVVALIRKRGLDPKPFVEILTNTMFGGRAHKIYGDKIVAAELRGRICPASRAQGCASGACRSGERGRPDAVRRRGARPPDHRNCARLRRSRLDRAWPDRRGGSRAQGRPRSLPMRLELSAIQAEGAREEEQDHGSSNRTLSKSRWSLPTSPAPRSGCRASRSAPGPSADGCGAEPTKPNPSPPSVRRSITASMSSTPRRSMDSAAPKRSSARQSPKGSCARAW